MIFAKNCSFCCKCGGFCLICQIIRLYFGDFSGKKGWQAVNIVLIYNHRVRRPKHCLEKFEEEIHHGYHYYRYRCCCCYAGSQPDPWLRQKGLILQHFLIAQGWRKQGQSLLLLRMRAFSGRIFMRILHPVHNLCFISAAAGAMIPLTGRNATPSSREVFSMEVRIYIIAIVAAIILLAVNLIRDIGRNDWKQAGPQQQSGGQSTPAFSYFMVKWRRPGRAKSMRKCKKGAFLPPKRWFFGAKP